MSVFITRNNYVFNTKLLIILFCLLMASCFKANAVYPQDKRLEVFELADLNSNDLIGENLDGLLKNHQEQRTQSFCGAASIAIAVDILKQERVRQYFVPPNVLSFAKVLFSGMSLKQLKSYSEHHGLAGELYYADSMTVETFKSVIIESLENPNQVVLLNYSRKVLGQEGNGHHSPVAAYDQKNDRVLIMDVSKNYPHTWVPLDLAFAAAKQKVASSNLSRGFLVVEAKD